MGIVTNGGTDGQEAKVDTLGIRLYMSAVVVSETVAVEKPDRRIFELALECLGARASQSWFVGDHPVNDVMGAAQAGLHAVWKRGAHPWPTEHEEPRFQIDSLEELSGLLER